MPGLPVPHHLLEFAQVHVHWIGDSIQPSYPLSPSCPALNLSQHQGLFQWVCWWPNHWSFSFSINPSSEYSALTSFRIDWIDLLAVQGTLRSLLQHHSINFFVSSISLFITFIIFIYLSIYHLLPVFYKKNVNFCEVKNILGRAPGTYKTLINNNCLKFHKSLSCFFNNNFKTVNKNVYISIFTLLFLFQVCSKVIQSHIYIYLFFFSFFPF